MVDTVKRVFCIGFSAAMLVYLCSTITYAQNRYPPLHDPDTFAWQIFVEINHPADLTREGGVPDRNKKIGDEGRVVWETWALAQHVYEHPDKPPQWPLESPTVRQLHEFEPEPLQQLIISQGEERARDPAKRPTVQMHGSEVRINQAAFYHIVANEFYNIEGQEAVFNKRGKFDFPLPSREIKSHWRRIDEQQKPRYHTTIVIADGEEELWGLVALHLTTKDLPNWFWATFEHKDNPGIDAVVPTRDTHGLPAVLKGTKWENYLLRGTQIDFTDPMGRPTILANSQIERSFQATSSCITCHARAVIGPRPRIILPEPGEEPSQSPDAVNRLPMFESFEPRRGSIGLPNPNWFMDTSTWPPARKFIQTDFVWSLFRAKRKIPLWPREQNEESETSEEGEEEEEFE